MPVTRVLVANRGEIALRIVRTCRSLGIACVAAYTRVDKDLRHLHLADDTVCIGEQNYLDQRALIAAAVSRGCDAVHPGYGLLSENAEFAAAVTAAGLTFIGPAAETISAMGDKVSARRLATEHGLEVVPGGDESAASEIGFPLLVKAAAGGGGRGMRIARDQSDLEAAMAAAKQEAGAVFGSDHVYLEKLLDKARHIEVQVLGDGQGNAIHLGSRDCTIQRSYQKLIEEASAPGIDDAGLESLCGAAASAAASLSYAGAGTFEFLYQDGQAFFIEMNTRLQVEHPVTEMVTGLDLVRAQIDIAATGSLPIDQSDVTFTGHAIECRINAETVAGGTVVPCPGEISELVLPGGPGIRVDTHLYAGYCVPHHYDSLVIKLIAHGASREEARRRLVSALGECEVRGIDTNRALLLQLLDHPDFVEGRLGPWIAKDALS